MKYLFGLLMIVLFGMHLLPMVGMAALLPYLYGTGLVLGYQLVRSQSRKLLTFG